MIWYLNCNPNQHDPVLTWTETDARMILYKIIDTRPNMTQTNLKLNQT